MERSELVIKIVFSLDSTFRDLSIDECRNILNIFPSFRYISLNANIRKSFHKYLCNYIYEKLFDHIKSTSYLVLSGYQNKQSYIDENISVIKKMIPSTSCCNILIAIDVLTVERLRQIEEDDFTNNIYYSFYDDDYEVKIITLMRELITRANSGQAHIHHPSHTSHRSDSRADQH